MTTLRIMVINGGAMNQKDLRAQRTHAAIHEAFKEMVCELDADRITIKALSERAGIHRKTFYLHYPHIEALFAAALEEVLAQYNACMDKLEKPLHIIHTNRVFFEFFAVQQQWVQKLICDDSYQQYCYALLYRSLAHNRQRYNAVERYTQEMRNVIDSFIINGTLTAYRQWMRDGRALPLEDVIALTGQLLENGVQAIR